MKIFCCDGSFEGILTAVFDAWKVTGAHIIFEDSGMEMLLAECTMVETDFHKAERIVKAVKEKISTDGFEMIYNAAMSCDTDRGDAILGFLRKGFVLGAGIVHDLHEPCVMKVFESDRRVKNEYCHYRGFLRFIEHNKYLLARYEPENNITESLAEFFSDRFHCENFVIVDMNRHRAAVHRAYGSYVMTDIPPDVAERLPQLSDDEEIKKLWETFSNTISIEERRNINLQRQNMPLRFRKYM